MSDNRLGSLSDILSKPVARPRLVPPVPVDEPAGEAIVQDPAPTSNAKAGTATTRSPRPAKAKVPASPAADEATHTRLVAKIPEDLHAKVSTRAVMYRSNQAAVVLEAVEHAYNAGVLADLLAPKQPQASGLFQGTADRRPAATAKTTLDARIRRTDLATLDSIAAEHGARDRTHLVIATLTYFFDQGPVRPEKA